MEKELLEDIRALMIDRRARQIRAHATNAAAEDMEEVVLSGETHTILKYEVALRRAVEEMQQIRQLIATLQRS